mmetsp:Transcript_63521/g.187520  ORF Transcript_63521/g.187520 Transcript_63521/m.187520 type:complete len:309 (-) Transcript_63521:115-1041(-)
MCHRAPPSEDDVGVPSLAPVVDRRRRVKLIDACDATERGDQLVLSLAARGSLSAGVDAVNHLEPPRLEQVQVAHGAEFQRCLECKEGETVELVDTAVTITAVTVDALRLVRIHGEGPRLPHSVPRPQRPRNVRGMLRAFRQYVVPVGDEGIEHLARREEGDDRCQHGGDVAPRIIHAEFGHGEDQKEESGSDGGQGRHELEGIGEERSRQIDETGACTCAFTFHPPRQPGEEGHHEPTGSVRFDPPRCPRQPRPRLLRVLVPREQRDVQRARRVDGRQEVRAEGGLHLLPLPVSPDPLLRQSDDPLGT